MGPFLSTPEVAQDIESPNYLLTGTEVMRSAAFVRLFARL